MGRPSVSTDRGAPSCLGGAGEFGGVAPDSNDRAHPLVETGARPSEELEEALRHACILTKMWVLVTLGVARNGVAVR